MKMNFDHIEPFVFGVDDRVCVYFHNDKNFNFHLVKGVASLGMFY